MSGRRHKSPDAWRLWRGHRQSNYRMSCVIRSAAVAVALAYLFISNFSSLLRLPVHHLSGCQRHLDEMDKFFFIENTWRFYFNFSAIGSWISNYFNFWIIFSITFHFYSAPFVAYKFYKQIKLRFVYKIFTKYYSVWKCLFGVFLPVDFVDVNIVSAISGRLWVYLNNPQPSQYWHSSYLWFHVMSRTTLLPIISFIKEAAKKNKAK